MVAPCERVGVEARAARQPDEVPRRLEVGDARGELHVDGAGPGRHGPEGDLAATAPGGVHADDRRARRKPRPRAARDIVAPARSAGTPTTTPGSAHAHSVPARVAARDRRERQCDSGPRAAGARRRHGLTDASGEGLAHGDDAGVARVERQAVQAVPEALLERGVESPRLALGVVTPSRVPSWSMPTSTTTALCASAFAAR